MNNGAELTLQIVRLVQAHAVRDATRTPQRWLFWPRGEGVAWDNARALLAGVAKPVLVAPLLEFGMVGIWTLETFEAANRQTVDRQLTNQVQYYREKLGGLSTDSRLIRFGSGASACQLTQDEFLQWAAEYALNVAISLVTSTETGDVRVIVRPAGGGPPITV